MAANGSGPRLRLRHALAGLQAGVLGALLMLGFLMLGGVWDRHSIWAVPNLFATTFFGSDAYRNLFTSQSLAGASIFIAIYGVLGALWGCLWRETQRPGLAFYGALTGLAIYFLFFDFVWKHVNPLIVLYAPNLQLQAGHVLWGLTLAQTPRFARRIASHLGGNSGEAVEIPAEAGELTR